MPSEEKVLAAILENCIYEALTGKRDDAGHLSEESQEKIDKFLAILDDPAALRELAAGEGTEPAKPEEPETARLSGWQPYTTRSGHRAWYDPNTGQRRYQDNEPGLGEGGSGGAAGGPAASSAFIPAQTYWGVALAWAQEIEEEYQGDDESVQKAYHAAAQAYHQIKKWAGGQAAAAVGAAMALASLSKEQAPATAAGLALLFLSVADVRDEAGSHPHPPTAGMAVQMVKDAAEDAEEKIPDPDPAKAGNMLRGLLGELQAAPPQQRLSHAVPDPDSDETMGADAEREAIRSARQLARDFRRDIQALLKKKLTGHEQLAQINGLLASWQQDFTDLLGEAILAGDLAGQSDVVRRLPAFPSVTEALPMIQAYLPRLRQLDPGSLRLFVSVLPPSYAEQLRIVAPDLAAKLPPPPEPPGATPQSSEPPRIRLWIVEEAVKDLNERSVLTPRQFGLLEGEARQRAFMVAGQEGREAVAKVRDLIAREVGEGASLPGFKARLRDEVERSALGEAQIETIFRTNVKHAYARGLDRVLDNPLVGNEFPYVERVPIRDDRLSEICRICSVSGIQGTGIYRRDDPVWKRIRPPSHYNCRCGVVTLSKEQAAAKGIKEAQEWVRTGRPPAVPAFVPMPDVEITPFMGG